MARYLAIDWDQNQLHVVAADIKGTTVKIRQAVVWSESQVPNLANAEDLGKQLREKLREANIVPAPVLATLGRDRLIVKEVRYPVVPEAEEPALVRFQTIKELSDAADEVIIDYLSGVGSSANERRAVSLVVRKEMLQTYETLCEAAGLKLVGLSPRLLGSVHCLRQVMGKTVVTPALEPADAPLAVVILGEKLAELSLHRGETLLLTRSLPIGPSLPGEIRRNLAVHAGQHPQHPIQGVYLAGKGAADLRDRLGETVEIPVHTFDPFAASDLTNLPSGNRGAFAGVVGLLYARAAGDLPINFVSPRQPKPPVNPNYGRIRLAVVAAVVLFAGLIVLGQVLQAAWQAELDELESQRLSLEQQLNSRREEVKRLKSIDEWESVVWLDEMYDLTARIPDVNALRITSFSAEPLTRNPKSKMAARVTIKGKLLNTSNPRRPLDQLVSQFSKDGFYSVDPPKVENDVFTLVVNVERRAPNDYKYLLKVDGK
jgi:Tfp pilus assembly PilM family ATPase